jgi:glucose/arabinose dehydrogenase
VALTKSLGLSTLFTVVMQLTLPGAHAANLPACDPDNGGLKLPPGFCALVVANDLGAARHMAVAPDGDLYVALQGMGGVAALHDSKGDGHFDVKEIIGDGSSTGVALHDGYLYVAKTSSVVRYKMTPGQLKPTGEPEVVVSDLTAGRAHADKGIAFDGKGSLYVNIGAPSNACQMPDRQKMVKGEDPCSLLDTAGGIWKFDDNKLDQKQSDGTRFATGMRQMPAITWHDGAVYVVMNSRDQLDTLWGDMFTAKENAERPAEPMYRATQGTNFGWPYCFYDYGQKKLLLNPEYGGDGKITGRCDKFDLPVTTFPAHWAPVDVMFYTGSQFPAKYRGGAFIAFHGSWNRAPMPMDGYNVTFQPFKGDKPSGHFEIFANGFAGADPLMSPAMAVARADGVAQAPDGSLYIGDSQKGKIWRVIYRGGK